MSEERYTSDFSDPASCDSSRSGGKGAMLSRLLQGGFPVPPGFCVAVWAYEEFLAVSGLDAAIGGILEATDADDFESLGAASTEIRRRIMAAPVPTGIVLEILEALQRQVESSGLPDIAVAVRSSMIGEDRPLASAAGQQESSLWVRGGALLVERVRSCWASLFTERAIAYRRRMGIPERQARMAVGVQRMVEVRASGVLFTLNPANGDPSKISIEASWGRGVAEGEVSPDRFLLDKVTLHIARALHADERKAAPGCLTKDELVALSRMAIEIEQHLGSPQDIEWAILRGQNPPGRIAILQSRPETVWSRRAPEALSAPHDAAIDHVVARLGGGIG